MVPLARVTGATGGYRHPALRGPPLENQAAAQAALAMRRYGGMTKDRIYSRT